MASTQPTAVLERLIDDDYLHEQLVAAGARLRDAYRRARHLPAEKAVHDPTLYDHVRGAAAAGTEAVRRAVGRPKPQPPRRRGRRLLFLLGMAVTAAAFYVARRADEAQRGADTAFPDAPPPAPGTTALHPSQ